MMADLHPVHSSLRGRTRRIPHNMDAIKLDNELRTALTDIALRIFADATNVDRSFQDAILAVYLSGLNHGYETMKESVTHATDEP